MTTPQVATPNRTPCLVAGAVAGCLVLCLCVAVGAGGWFYLVGPGQSAPIMDSLRATPAPLGQQFGNAPGTPMLVQPAATRPSSEPSTGAPASDMQTFAGKAPYSLQYPSDWDVNDDEADNQIVVFVSPDVDAYAAVRYQDASPDSADSLMTNMLNDLPGNEGSVKVVSKKTNQDGSVFEEVTYEDSDLGGTTHAYARVVKTKTYSYLVIFGTLTEQFSKYKDIGNSIVNSFAAK